MPPSSSVVLNGPALDRMLRGPEGPIYRVVHAVVTETAELARMKVRPGSVGAGPNFGRRGHLRDSYVSRMLGDGSGMAGSPLPQSVWVEEGTRPHIIRPRKARALRFYSVRIAGARGLPVATPLFAQVVHHPGTKAQHILTRSLTEAIVGRVSIP